MQTKSSLLVLFLLALVALSSSVDASETRALRVQAADEAAQSSSSASGGSHAAAAGEAASEAHSTSEGHKAKGPSTSSFTGPLIAGTVAIILIGAVVKFKNRQSEEL